MDRIIIFILFILCARCSDVFATEPVVIAESSVSETKLLNSDLVYIFTRQRMFWADGHRIKVFVKPPDSIEHKLFTINVLKLSPYKYRSLLDSIIYSGFNTSAIEVTSDEEMALKVASTPYSIGYLNYSTIISNQQDLITIHYE